MSDQGFREVQLSGKQVVFLFMALAVALVGTFLLGVSVGRHVEPEATSAQATPASTPTTAADVTSSGPMPTATVPQRGDRDYATTLRDKPEPGNAKPAATPQSTPSPEPVTPAPKATPTPTSQPTPTTAPAGGSWYVQVDSFSTKENAAREVSDLKAKHVTAVAIKSGTHFQVRVGPFERPAADAMHDHLKKLGYSPRVIR